MIASFARAGVKSSKKINVYIMLGDSNMNGVALSDSSIDPKYLPVLPQVLIYYKPNRSSTENGGWQKLQHRFNDYPGYGVSNNPADARYGATIPFAYRIAQLTTQPVGIIKVALGGSTLLASSGLDNDWSVTTGELYKSFREYFYTVGIAKLVAEGYTPVVKGVLVRLGTNDCLINRYNDSSFKAAIGAFVSGIRDYLKLPSLPFYWIQVRADLYNATISTYPQASVNAARAAITACETVGNAAYISNFKVINYDNNTLYPLATDLVHFTSAAYTAMGLYEANTLFTDTGN